MYIIGIDPGISGAICFFENGKVIDVLEMPSMAEGKKNKKQVNGAQIYSEINSRIKDKPKKSNLCGNRACFSHARTGSNKHV